MRHSGASWDALTKSRSLQAIQKRGRWRAASSVSRYEKAGRVAVLFNALPEQTRLLCQHAEAHLSTVLASPAKARETLLRFRFPLPARPTRAL
eukprot:157143-Amphidinium_carterae.1